MSNRRFGWWRWLWLFVWHKQFKFVALFRPFISSEVAVVVVAEAVALAAVKPVEVEVGGHCSPCRLCRRRQIDSEQPPVAGVER
jgi:hypothetical protein